MDALTEAVANGETIKAEIIGDEAAGRAPTMTAPKLESNEAAAQPKIVIPAKKPAPKGKDKKGAAPADSADKGLPTKIPATAPG